MILKRQEKNGKIKAMYSSSTICASIYDTTTKDLIVIFNNGGQYKYPNVDLTDYTRVETAESNGSEFNTRIKKKYTNFEKLEKIDGASLNAILDEIESLKEAEDKATMDGVTKQMMSVMADMVANYIANEKVSQDMLRKLETKILAYNKVANPEPTQAEA
jgi:predicted transcriptional regulator